MKLQKIVAWKCCKCNHPRCGGGGGGVGGGFLTDHNTTPGNCVLGGPGLWQHLNFCLSLFHLGNVISKACFYSEIAKVLLQTQMQL